MLAWKLSSRIASTPEFELVHSLNFLKNIQILRKVDRCCTVRCVREEKCWRDKGLMAGMPVGNQTGLGLAHFNDVFSPEEKPERTRGLPPNWLPPPL